MQKHTNEIIGHYNIIGLNTKLTMYQRNNMRTHFNASLTFHQLQTIINTDYTP